MHRFLNVILYKDEKYVQLYIHIKESLPRVEEFNYFGVLFTSKGKI